jgi:hypothetical protein
MYAEITDELRDFIERQQMFFVATAPLAADGAVNVSPKGMDSLRVLGPRRVAYLDLTGSGNETSAHLLENGRLTMMFCAFAGPPRILRLYGTGATVLPESTEWTTLYPAFTAHPGARQIIILDVERVQTSCGFAVPRYEYVSQRTTLDRWTAAKGDDIEDYRREKNARSIDGLPSPLGSREAENSTRANRTVGRAARR